MPIRRRSLLASLGLLACLVASPPPRAHADPAQAWSALAGGAIVLFRHATAPGVGDPAGFRLGDCATQRNLDDRGRAEARAIGKAFASRKIAVGAVLASQWCRATETAELAFPGRVKAEPAFNSFFDDRGQAPAQTAAARSLLLDWKGPGALVVATHQVNIQALTGLALGSGEGVVLVVRGGKLEIVGRIRP